MLKRCGKRIAAFVLCCLWLVAVCACGQNRVSADIRYLTGEGCAGRLYGTPGNQKAADYIAGELAESGVSFLAGEGHAVPFAAELPQVEATRMAIQAEEGEIELEEGTHYIPPVSGAFSLWGTLGQPEEEFGVPILPVETQNGAVRLVQSETRLGSASFSQQAQSTLYVTQAGMHLLSQHSGEEWSYDCLASWQTFELPNVLGVVPGKDRSRAVVLGAHFDHMGAAGGTLFPGAVDNASGVAALLEAARHLAPKQPETDVVLAFWNAEEFGQLGSEAGVQLLETLYTEFCYINLDCLGHKNGGPLQIVSANYSQPLSAALVSALGEAGYDEAMVSQEGMTSDHVSFSSHGAVSVGQSMDILSTIIHLSKDTKDLLDEGEIARFGAALAAAAQQGETLVDAGLQSTPSPNNANSIFPPGDFSAMDARGQMDYTGLVGSRLACDECAFLPSDRGRTSVVGTSSENFPTLADAQALFPGFTAKEALGEYVLTGIRIQSHTQLATGEEPEFYTVYKRLLSAELIFQVTLYYQSEESGFSYSEFYTAQAPGEETLERYAAHEPLPGAENTWLLCEEDETRECWSYLSWQNGVQSGINVGTLRINEYGSYGLFWEETSREAVLDALAVVEQFAPLVETPHA